MKKKYLLIIGAIVIVSILISIAVISLLKKQYNDTFSTSEICSSTITSFVTEGGIYTLDDDVILEIHDEFITYLIDYEVARAKNTKNINEIGIFRVTEGKQRDMKNILENYVKKKQESYRAMDYFPEETEKIDFATVKVLGSYVIYSFLNESDTKAFYQAIENKIRK